MTSLLSRILIGILLATTLTSPITAPDQPTPPEDTMIQTIEREYYFNNLKEFTTVDVDGDTVTQDIFKSKDINVVHFWSTSCIDCLNELHLIEAAHQSLPDNAQLITVLIQNGEFIAKEAKQYLEKYGITARTLILGDGDLLSAKDKLTWIPTTLIVDSDGDLMCEGLVGGTPERWVEKVAGLEKGV